MCFTLPKFCLLSFLSIYLYSETTYFLYNYFVRPYFIYVYIYISLLIVYMSLYFPYDQQARYVYFSTPIAMQWHSALCQEAPLGLMRLSPVITLPWWIIWSIPRSYSGYHIEAIKCNITVPWIFHQEVTDTCISKSECCLIHLITDDIHINYIRI